jgi:hypothetical protein
MNPGDRHTRVPGAGTHESLGAGGPHNLEAAHYSVAAMLIVGETSQRTCGIEGRGSNNDREKHQKAGA